MSDIEKPIEFKNLEYDPNKPLSKEFLIRRHGRYFISKKYKNAMIVSPNSKTYEYIVDKKRYIDMGTFKPQLLDKLADFIHRMKREPNEWELQDMIKYSVRLDDYEKISPR